MMKGSMAQRQNRDAGKVEKILPVQVALQWVRAKGAVPLARGQKSEARPGDHRVPGLGARGKRGRGARRRAAAERAQVRAAALS